MNVTDKKLMNSKSGLKIVLSSDIASPFYKSEPRWIPDNEVFNNYIKITIKHIHDIFC